VEVSAAVRHIYIYIYIYIYMSLGFKRLIYSQFIMHGQKNIMLHLRYQQ